jgi:hypothetical protein
MALEYWIAGVVVVVIVVIAIILGAQASPATSAGTCGIVGNDTDGSFGSGYCGIGGFYVEGGGDANAGDAIEVSSPSQCAAVCDSRPDCNGYVMNWNSCYPKNFADTGNHLVAQGDNEDWTTGVALSSDVSITSNGMSPSTSLFTRLRNAKAPAPVDPNEAMAISALVLSVVAVAGSIVGVVRSRT